MSSEINDCVRRTLNRYFRDLDGQAPHAVYGMVLKCVERPMLEVVMKQAEGNQTVAADMHLHDLVLETARARLGK